MRLVLFVALALATVAIARAAKVEDAFPQPFGAYTWQKPPYTDEFKKLVAAGMEALKHGQTEKGVHLLTLAAKVRLPNEYAANDPVPNFELWDDIAIAACKRSDFAKGRSLLADYKCAVDVMVHGRQCYLGDVSSVSDPSSADAFEDRAPNAAFTPLCFRTMCGDGWKANGWRLGADSSDDPEGAAKSLGELKRADRLIKECRPHARE